MSENTKENQLGKRQPNVTLLVITAACIFILMGILLLTVPQIQIVTIAYILSTAAIVLGIILIVRYFLSEAYRNMNQYGFSVGSLFVIIGVCAMVKAEAVSEYFILCLGLLILVSAVVKLQNALDLKALEYRIWTVFLGIAIAMLSCAVVILIAPFAKPEDLEHFTYVILIADGAFGLISTICLHRQVKRFEKSMKQFEDAAKETEAGFETEEQPETPEEKETAEHEEI